MMIAPTNLLNHSFLHLFVRVINSRRAVLFFLLLLPFLSLLSPPLHGIRSIMVLIPAIDIFGLPDFVVGFPFNVISQFLLVYHPAVVLAVVAVAFLFLHVLTGRQSTI